MDYLFFGELGELDRVPAMDAVSGALQKCGLVVVLVDTIQSRYMDVYCNPTQSTNLEYSDIEEDDEEDDEEESS